MNVRKLWVGLTGFAFVFALAGCGGGSGGAAKDSEGLTKVRVASLTPTVFTVGLPQAVAEARGFYKEEGIVVKPIYTDGGGANTQAIASGNADISTQTGTSAVLAAVSNGAKLKIIGSGFRGIDGLWLAEPDSKYKSIDDLSGATLGYTSPGSSSNVAIEALSAILKGKGLKAAKGEPIGDTSDQLTAMSTGQIDGAYTNPPVALDKVKSGELKIILDGFSDIPAYNEVSTRVSFASEDFIKNNPDAVDAWLRAMEKTWDWIFENQAEAAQIWIEAGGLDLTEEQIVDTFGYYNRELLASTPIMGLDKSAADAVSFGSLKKPMPKDELDALVR